MSEGIALHPVNPEHHPLKRVTGMDVVFVHGLNGDWDETWRHNSGQWWPQWLADDDPTIQVWSLGYPAKIGHLHKLGPSTQLSAAELGVALAARLRNHQISTRPCIFVCHSLGGLLAKRILLAQVNSSDVDRFRHENVAGLMFLGTPHRGSALANVLKATEGIGKAAFKAVLACAGIGVEGIEKHVLTTTGLIKELEKDDLGLQHLNERFGLYFSERAKTNVLRVRVLAETEPMPIPWLGIPTPVLIVDKESANPKLRADSSKEPIEPVAVPSVNHSTLVKLDTRGGDVWSSLCDLIYRVRVEQGFELADPLCNVAAQMIFGAVLKQPNLLELPTLLSLDKGESLEVIAARRIAENLACRKGQDLLDAITLLSKAVRELDRSKPGLGDSLDALERVTGALSLLALGTVGTAEVDGSVQGTADFEVPSMASVDDLEDAEAFLNVLIEVLHAARMKWPARLQRDPATGRARPRGAWVMGSDACAPSSWHPQAQVHHVVERVLASRPQGAMPASMSAFKASQAQAPAVADADEPTLAKMPSYKLTQVHQLLRSRRLNEVGLVILANQTAFRDPALRKALSEQLSGMVSFATAPAGVSEADDETLSAVAGLHLQLEQFMIAVQDVQLARLKHA